MENQRAKGLLVSALGRLLADLVFPRGCAACDAELQRRAVFCSACAPTVLGQPAPRFFDGSVDATVSYGGAVSQALHRLKYCGRIDVAPQLGALLAKAIGREGFDLVLPVPLHPVRLAERGFNQATLLVRSLDDASRASPTALTRTRPTPQQTRLARAERAKNVAGAFRASARIVTGANVLLIDDVVTTGATLAACRDALIEAGASSVSALAVARAD